MRINRLKRLAFWVVLITLSCVALAGDVTIRLDQAGSFIIQDPNATRRIFQLSETRDQSTGLVTLSESVSGGGFVGTSGRNGQANVWLTNPTGNPEHGFISTFDAQGVDKANVFVDDFGQGRINLVSANNDLVIDIQDTGSGAGFVETNGPNGQANVRLSSLSGNANHGFIAVKDALGNNQATIFVDSNGNGVVSADLKPFIEEHPDKPGSRIIYISLEGPEAGMYHRGRVDLTNGRGLIELPEHFTALAAMETVTVQLTPHSLQSRGLGVGDIGADTIEVGELYGGNGSYAVSFIVHAARARFVDHEPVVDNASTKSFSSNKTATAAARNSQPGLVE